MKKSNYAIMMLALSAGFMMTACGEKPAQNEVTVEQAEPIVVEKTETIIVEEEKPEEPTTVVLDKNGVKVVTKKIDVKIEKD